jgi:hypothetical protein
MRVVLYVACRRYHVIATEGDAASLSVRNKLQFLFYCGLCFHYAPKETCTVSSCSVKVEEEKKMLKEEESVVGPPKRRQHGKPRWSNVLNFKTELQRPDVMLCKQSLTFSLTQLTCSSNIFLSRDPDTSVRITLCSLHCGSQLSNPVQFVFVYVLSTCYSWLHSSIDSLLDWFLLISQQG